METGDIKHNVGAPIVIMTTERYRNTLLGNKEHELDKKLGNVATVVMDEFHYMNDNDRGIVWEESVMFTPGHIQLLPLSATIGNANK